MINLRNMAVISNRILVSKGIDVIQDASIISMHFSLQRNGFYSVASYIIINL